MSVNCPTCNTSFPTNKAPWLQTKQYCAKHDNVYLPGMTCQYCDMEAANAQMASGSGGPVLPMAPQVGPSGLAAKITPAG